MSVVQARLEDVISYSDFNQEVPIQKILVQDLLDNHPEDNLLQDLLSGDTPINETDVHVVSSGKFDKIMKVTTNFSTAQINGNLRIGNVLVGNSSNGFLETVNEIVEDEEAKFVYTELTTFSSGFLSSKK